MLIFSYYKKSILVLFFCTLLVFFLTTAGAYGGDPIRIMPLGDSITAGYGSAFSVGYRQALFLSTVESGYEIDFVGNQKDGEFANPFFDADHEGHPGWGTYQVAEHVYEWLPIIHRI